MKKYIALLATLCMLLGMCACNPAVSGGDYKNTDQAVNGGTAQSDVNLKDISTVQSGEETEVRFSFVSGSKTATGNESNIIGVPEYTVSFCENPTRLVLSVKNLAYWDFQQNTHISDDTGLVMGCFKVLPAGGRTNSQIYLNLSQKVDFRVAQSDGVLSVFLRKKDTAPSVSYYVVGNLFYEYQEGALDEDAGLTPTLTKDGSAVVMISEAFDNEADALSLKSEIEAEYPRLLENKQLRIFSTGSGELPGYADGGELNELNEKIIINRSGIGESANVFFADGRPLCISNDDTKAIFARKEVSDKYDTERLFVVDKNGSIKKLTEYETTSVAFAKFSPDDKYLLYVEQIEGTMLASVYSFEQNSIISIDADILGTFITEAAWSSGSDAIYFMAGVDIPYLSKFDIASQSITKLSDKEQIETDIYCSGNYLYFNTVNDDKEELVRYDIASGNSEALLSCDYFTVDASGSSILYTLPYKEQEGKYALYIYSMQNRQTRTIIDNITIGEYFFSHDGKKVYFSIDSETDDQYVQKVYEYDINSGILTELFTSISADFSPSWTDDGIMMKITYEKDGSSYPATYQIRLK